jgi:hypothetical protein
MSFGKRTTPQSEATFGRRGAVSRTQGRPTGGTPRSTASARPEQRTADASRDASQAMGGQIGLSASRGKAYAKAVVAGAITFIAVLFMLTGVDSKIFRSGPMLAFLAVPILPTLALILYIPTVVLSDVARLLAIPRGWADIAIGTTLGLGLGIATALSGTQDDGKALMLALAMTAAGVVGGFAFWRAQGYPGLTGAGAAAALDKAYEKLP